MASPCIHRSIAFFDRMQKESSNSCWLLSLQALLLSAQCRPPYAPRHSCHSIRKAGHSALFTLPIHTCMQRCLPMVCCSNEIAQPGCCSLINAAIAGPPHGGSRLQIWGKFAPQVSAAGVIACRLNSTMIHGTQAGSSLIICITPYTDSDSNPLKSGEEEAV